MSHRSRKGNTLLLLLLAVVCIGGAELVVCKYADPALYQRITEPVRQGAVWVWDKAAAAWDEAVSLASRAAGSLRRNEAAPLEDQAALEPDVSAIPMADGSLTSLENRPEGEILIGGNHEVVYFNQGDPAWSDQPYGKDTIGRYGCGPTALAMAVSSLTDETVDPVSMARWAVENGYWARHGGSYLSIVNGAADFGLRVKSVPDCTTDQLLLELASGKMAVALMSAGHFTKSGHFILLRDATLDGSILVADPNSRERSLAVWDPELILSELSKSRNNGAPLWFISPADGP